MFAKNNNRNVVRNKRCKDPVGLSLIVWTWVLLGLTNAITVLFIFARAEFEINENLLLSTIHAIRQRSFTWKCLLGFFEILHLLAIASHIAAAAADPGTLRKYNCPITLDNDSNGTTHACARCNGRWKPLRAHHCNRCGECVFRMDHHCPWIANCIGLANQKYFILFLTHSIGAALLDTACVVIHIVQFLFFDGDYSLSIPVTVGSCMVLIISLVFLRIAVDFWQEQLEAVMTNSTLIESYKGIHGKQKGFTRNLEEIFGKNYFLWLVPIPPILNFDFNERVYDD